MTDTNPTPATPEGADRVQDRIEAFGREAQAAGERLGEQAQRAGDQAQRAGERLAHDPGVIRVASFATRLWGLAIIAVGLWWFAGFTLGLPLPDLSWRDLWPAVLIVIGAGIVIQGLLRRTR